MTLIGHGANANEMLNEKAIDDGFELLPNKNPHSFFNTQLKWHNITGTQSENVNFAPIAGAYSS